MNGLDFGGGIKTEDDVVSVFEAVGALSGGKIGEAELLEVERTATLEPTFHRATPP